MPRAADCAVAGIYHFPEDKYLSKSYPPSSRIDRRATMALTDSFRLRDGSGPQEGRSGSAANRRARRAQPAMNGLASIRSMLAIGCPKVLNSKMKHCTVLAHCATRKP